MSKKPEEATTLAAGIARSNFIRAACVEWMRTNAKVEHGKIVAEAERRYPRRRAKTVDLSFLKT